MKRYWFRHAARAASGLLMLFAGAAASRAGDTAQVKVLGFSADGGIFAFEEYGVQDGSGFPYADRFYIDTAHDGFVPGTPVRVRLDDENATLSDARAAARRQSQHVIADSTLAAHPGYRAGWNAVTELSADPHRIAVNPRPVFPPIDDPVEFRLDEIPVPTPANCQNLGDIVGFRLLRVGTSAGSQTALVHQDSHVPPSRGCPLGYRIGGLQTYFPEPGSPVFALMIAIRQVGFEGPDFRWIAVTGRL